MDFKSLLTNRRAIREFQDKEVPLHVLKEIIHAFLIETRCTD
jgi:nitroreductase